MSASIYGSICLRYKEVLFAIGRQIFDLVGHSTLLHFPVRRLDKPKLIDPGKSAHRANQPNVRPFWRLDGTNAPIVRRMNVTHLEPGTLTAETAGPKSRQAPLVRQFRERIRLVHEL